MTDEHDPSERERAPKFTTTSTPSKIPERHSDTSRSWPRATSKKKQADRFSEADRLTESRLIGWLVEEAAQRDDSTLRRCIDAGLHPDHFADPIWRKAYQVIRDGGSADALDLMRAGVGAVDLGEARNIAGTGAHAIDDFAAIILAASRRREALAAERLIEAIETRDVDAIDDARAALASTEAGNRRSRWPAPVSAATLCENPPATPPVLIEGVLYRGGTMLFAGPSKAKKTFTGIDLAVAIATGSPWFGFQTSRAPVLYINLELPEHVAEKRVRTICERHGIKPPADLHFWNLRGEVVTIEDLARELPDRIARNGYGLVVIDPHYKVSATSGAEENSNDSIGLLLSRLEAIHAKHGAALAITHHFAKGDASQKNAIDRASGGGVFARWPDVFMSLTPHEEDEAMTVDLILRSFAPVPSFAVRWDYPIWTNANDLDPSKLKRAGRSDAHPPTEAVGKLRDGMSGKEWNDALGWTESTFRRKRNDLLSARRVRQSGGCYYHVKTAVES